MLPVLIPSARRLSTLSNWQIPGQAPRASGVAAATLIAGVLLGCSGGTTIIRGEAETTLVGTLSGGATEAGDCLWLTDSASVRWRLALPVGRAAAFEPARIYTPDGVQIAAAGDRLVVEGSSGAEQTNCSSPPFDARTISRLE